MNEIKRQVRKETKEVLIQNYKIGNYTEERHKIHKGKTVKSIIQEIKESRKK